MQCIDPADPPTWTGTWRDPRFSPPADGGRPENALVGTLFRMNGGQNGTITVPQADGRMRFWRNTSVSTLGTGQQATLAPGTIGAEFDDDEDNGFRPAGLFELSNTPITDSSNFLLDYGSAYGAGTVIHKMTLYKALSGAWVFAAGTYQWSWGLDSNHDRSNLGSTTDVRMQQATVNLFADMGAQPATLQAGLTAATASTDTSAPGSAITSPAAGSNLPLGSPVTITGTAADAGLGVVAGVEVSVDGGTTWHPATGREAWSYAWTPAASGSVTIKSRAVDDSGNVETPSAGVVVTVGGGGTDCTTNCTIWPGTVPGIPDSGPDSAVELGVKFRADFDGTITGIRFYKASTNTGTHVGNLWSSSGQLLASATFSGETASGWQQVNFSSPVTITANTVYVASYHLTAGHYSDDQNYFATTGVNNPPLHALQNGVSGFNGVFAYGAGSNFPNQGFNSSNYWVDVVFTSTTQTWSISGTTTAGGAGATVSLSGAATATTTADASGNYTFTGLVNGSYTVTPTKSGVIFSPVNQAVTVNSANVSGINFTATAQTWSISGTTTAGGAGATVSLSGAATATTTADASGNYTFTGLVNGSYTVTPTKSGVTFSPVNQAVTVNSANVSGINFTATAQTWSISGTTTAGGAGATVSLSGAATATTTADASGNYTFTGLANGSYTVTPTKSGVTFTPASLSPTVNGANVTGVNFTAQLNPTWSISGTTTAGGAGATVSLSGAATATTTADASGNYTFTGLANGSYTVTPTKSGVTFTPASLSPTVNGANVYGRQFHSTIESDVEHLGDDHGRRCGGDGQPVWRGDSDDDRRCLRQLHVHRAGERLVYGHADQIRRHFLAGQPIAHGQRRQRLGHQFHTQSAPTWSISGTTTAGGAGATVSLSGTATATTTADGSGNYTFTGLANGSYTVTPTKSGVTFSPVNQAVTVNGANVSGINFSTTAPTWSISGTTTAGGAGATVSLSGTATATTTADGSGNYTFTGLANGSYTVTPTKSGVTFSPVNQAVTVNGANVSGINFSTTAPTWSISGTTTAGGAGATVSLSGTATATTTADASGNYTFTGLANGSYTVTPTKSGVTFSPVSQAVTVNGANVAGINFTATAQTWSISGTTTAGGAGATVSLSGAATATTTADASGNYTFTGLANGSYTVTPTKSGVTFSPVNQAVTV